VPLYHFSEDPGIRRFVPHRPPTSLVDEELIWAIDEWHAPMYCFPRDCPRACFWSGPQTTKADRKRWFGGIEAKMVIAVETTWLARIRSTVLYRYEMPEDAFVLNDATAGHWVSHAEATPLSVEPVGDLLDALAAANVELRITPALIALWQLVIASTLKFSGTRLRNAAGYAAAFGGHA
jgi:hypothetical protein